jgi:hypothetical protein
MTATVFVIRNQSGQFLSKQNEWVDAGQPATLYRTVHRDEAVNTVFEISAKDIYLRAELVACRLDDRGAPALDQQVLDQQAAPSEHAGAASDA